jgi:hypothetical protein
VVVPDTGGLARIGESTLSGKVGGRGDSSFGDGFGGLKKLGVKEMTYKVRFLQCMRSFIEGPTFDKQSYCWCRCCFHGRLQLFRHTLLPTILSVMINHYCMPTR